MRLAQSAFDRRTTLRSVAWMGTAVVLVLSLLALPAFAAKTSKTDMSAVANKSFSSCDGCEAGIALKLGAEQSVIGIVKRATQTDYYIVMQIRDARAGKILDQQAVNFAGGEEGWGTGARVLIRHQILPSKDQSPAPR